MIPAGWNDEEHAAFWRGFNMAQPPGRQELDDLAQAAEVAPPEAGQLRVSLPKALAKAFLAELDALPENLAGAAWTGFLRGMIAQAGGPPVHCHESGRA